MKLNLKVMNNFLAGKKSRQLNIEFMECLLLITLMH